jgi:hypothetical protein
MSILEDAISEADHDNIPKSILQGRGKELQHAVANVLAWGRFLQMVSGA